MTYRLFDVPGTGIEPAHPCERQILSLLRLPIPPPGHYNFQVFVFRVAILRNPSNLSKIPFTIFSFHKIKT